MPKHASHASEGEERIFSREECQSLFDRVRSFARGGGHTMLGISSWWQGELRWARNRVSLASDRRNIELAVNRGFAGTVRTVFTNQVDDASLEAAVRAAERVAQRNSNPGTDTGFLPELPRYTVPESLVWSDATYAFNTEARSAVARSLVEASESKGLLSAGYLEARAGALAFLGSDTPELRKTEFAFWHQPYVRFTQTHCSLTVRDARGRGSGWAGQSSFDWNKITPEALGERAIEKCLASRNPVALEPGRYLVVLEAQAVADLMEMLAETFTSREAAESRGHTWTLGRDEALGLWRSKLGLKVVDERISISHDLRDPEQGIVVQPNEYPKPVKWIDKGVLTSLGHTFTTDIRDLEGWHRLRGLIGYRMSGGDTTVEEMIGSTRRGLLVTRLSNVRRLDQVSRLSTGFTRDGLWLIENGKITKAVKNFRFTESPLFMLNNIEQLGEPVPVFRPTRDEGGRLTPAIVPPLKVRDFSFTSAIDAV